MSLFFIMLLCSIFLPNYAQTIYPSTEYPSVSMFPSRQKSHNPAALSASVVVVLNPTSTPTSPPIPNTLGPSQTPSESPSVAPSTQLPTRPTLRPSSRPTTVSNQPTLQPSSSPSEPPSRDPTSSPSDAPSVAPTSSGGGGGGSTSSSSGTGDGSSALGAGMAGVAGVLLLACAGAGYWQYAAHQRKLHKEDDGMSKGDLFSVTPAGSTDSAVGGDDPLHDGVTEAEEEHTPPDTPIGTPQPSQLRRPSKRISREMDNKTYTLMTRV